MLLRRSALILLLASCSPDSKDSSLFDLTTYTDNGAPDGTLLLTILQEYPAIALIRGDGEILWSLRDDSRPNSNATITRAHLDGDSLTYIYYTPANQATASDDYHLLVDIDVGTKVRSETQLDDLHHDFTILPEGGIAYLSKEWNTISGGQVSGDTIVELMPNGDKNTVWSAWDHLEFDDRVISNGTGNWSHANVLSFNESSNEYSIGLRNLNAIVRIDRATGETLGVFSPDHSTLLGDGQFQVWQHGFQWLSESGLLLFDNGSKDIEDSRAVEFEIDWQDNSVEQVWEHRTSPTSYTFVLGDVRRMSNGDTLIAWGDQGRMDRVTPNGDVVWSLTVDGKLGYFEWIPD